MTLEDAIENIDIGGPAMVRSSAKNYAGVAIVTDPEDYAPLLAEMKANGGGPGCPPASPWQKAFTTPPATTA